MSRKLKVYGGLTVCLHNRHSIHNQSRTIVAATSRKEVLALLQAAGEHGATLSWIANYWSETGNALELATATEKGVWVNTGDDWKPVFKRARPRLLR